MTDPGRDAVLEHFRWVEGHADIWRVFAHGAALQQVVIGLVEPWRGKGITRVVGIESRGFLLGAAVAIELGAGFVAIRKSGTGLLPGPKLTTVAARDYRGNEHRLRMQSVLTREDQVLLVDDWAERGSQALAARELVGRCGAVFVGVCLIVDMLPDETRASLGRVTSLVRAEELGASG